MKYGREFPPARSSVSRRRKLFSKRDNECENNE